MIKRFGTTGVRRNKQASRQPQERARKAAPFVSAACIASLLVVLIILAGAGSAAHAQSAGADAGLVAAMARFDRAFIPALAVTNQGNLEKAKKALSRLEGAWVRFKDEYGSYEKEPRWRDALGRIDGAVMEAAARVGRGELAEAHEALERVRDAYLAIREDRSLNYYLDHLNRYHETMEEALREAAEAGSKGLDEARRGRLLALEGEARRRWEALSEGSFDPALFGFDRGKTRELVNAVAAVGMSLNALRAAFCEKDGEALVKAARDLRPPYVKAYLMFGDFDGLE